MARRHRGQPGLPPEELHDPGWLRDKSLLDSGRLAGPVYRLLDRASAAFVHVRSFLDRWGRIERKKREAKRREMERRVVRENGPHRRYARDPFS